MIRSNMIRILLDREFLRLRKNPSVLLLLGLITAIALLTSTSRPLRNTLANSDQTRSCWVVYWQDSDWVQHLRESIPDGMDVQVVPAQQLPQRKGELCYPPGCFAIELVTQDDRSNQGEVHIRYRHEASDRAALSECLMWFWPTTTEYFSDLSRISQETTPLAPLRKSGGLSNLRQASLASLANGTLIGSVLLYIVQFFACCHLLVSFSSQDRERGTLRALALTPVSFCEMLIARFSFHMLIAVTGSAMIAAFVQPTALLQPLFWCSLILTGICMMSVGTLIAVLAKTQATASFLTVCYMLIGGAVFYLGSRYPSMSFLKQLAFEHYSFRISYLSLHANSLVVLAPGLLALAVLAAIWLAIAAFAFRLYGWR